MSYSWINIGDLKLSVVRQYSSIRVDSPEGYTFAVPEVASDLCRQNYFVKEVIMMKNLHNFQAYKFERDYSLHDHTL
jgi:hypothetical protein